MRYLSVPRFRLSTLLLIVVICALIARVYIQDRRWNRVQSLRALDLLAVQIPVIFGTVPLQKFAVQDAEGERVVNGFPVVVDKDGSLGLPMIGKMHIAGKSPEEVQQMIVDAYQKFGLQMVSTDVKVTPISKRASSFQLIVK